MVQRAVQLPAIVLGDRLLFALVHDVQGGKGIAPGEAVVGEQLGHLVFFGCDQEQHGLRRAEDAIGLGVMGGLVAVQVGRVDEDGERLRGGGRGARLGIDDRQRRGLSAGGKIGGVGDDVLDAEPVGGNGRSIRDDGHRAAGEGPAEAGCRHRPAQHAVDQRALTGARAAQDCDEHGPRVPALRPGVAQVAQMEAQGLGIGATAAPPGGARPTAPPRRLTAACRAAPASGPVIRGGHPSGQG